jgi:hypothetical protein
MTISEFVAINGRMPNILGSVDIGIYNLETVGRVSASSYNSALTTFNNANIHNVTIRRNVAVTVKATATTGAATVPTGAKIESVVPAGNQDQLIDNVAVAATSVAAATGTITSDTTNPATTGTVVVGSKTYTFKTALTEVAATGTLTSDATNVTNLDTVTLGAVTYRLMTVPVQAYDVLIGVDAATTLANLKKAINATGTTEYFAGTLAHPTILAGAINATTLVVTARTVGTAGNSLASTETSSHLSFGGATLAGGVNAVANEVFIGANTDATLANLVSAINGTAGAGTTYSTGTTANVDVTAAGPTTNVVTVTAVSTGFSGKLYRAYEDCYPHYRQRSWDAFRRTRRCIGSNCDSCRSRYCRQHVQRYRRPLNTLRESLTFTS